MKVLYIGKADEFARMLINRFVKEEDEVFLVAKQTFTKELKPSLSYKYYEIDDRGTTAEKIFTAVHPETVVFGGENLLERDWNNKSAANEHISMLQQWLTFCREADCRFIYLSSTEVYGNQCQCCDEQTGVAPETLRGRTDVIAEDLIKCHSEMSRMSYAILRCGQIYDFQFQSGSGTFLSQIGDEVLTNTQIHLNSDISLQPIAAGDLADALRRVLSKNKKCTFNVCSTDSLRLSEIYRGIADKLNASSEITSETTIEGQTILNTAAKRELEWNHYKDLAKQLQTEELIRRKRLVKQQNIITNKKKTIAQPIMRVAETLILFVLFWFASSASQNNVMFSAVNWMMIYIIIIALFYGTRYSFLAILLSSVAYFWKQDLQIVELSNFYSYIGGIVKIIEYIFTGIIISYTADMMREDLRSRNVEKKLLQEEMRQLEVINDENVKIKNEYEKRLLSAKTSLPKLYSIISRINVLQPDRIFSEILNVVADIMDTGTVSVYLMRKDSSYLRLITSLNERSVYGGKSWNLEESPLIYEVIKNQELFVGNRLEQEPAFAAPIISNGHCIAVILIMEMPFAGQSLYYTNLLRTLSVLVSEAMSKALDYEKRIQQNRYIEDTEVLKNEEFEVLVNLSKEKKEQGVADYCIVECTPPEGVTTIAQFYQKISKLFRDTDVLGAGETDTILALLPNNTEEEGMFVINRLQSKGISAQIL